MTECSSCGFPFLPGEIECPECGYGGEDWSPDDEDDDPGPGPYLPPSDGLAEVCTGP